MISSRLGLSLALAAALPAVALVSTPDLHSSDEPPRRLRMTPDNRDFCARIGIVFKGRVRTDVVAYDVDAGWIETLRGATLSGTVAPYWRGAASAASHIGPAPQSADSRQRALETAREKRARKAAKRAERSAAL